MSVSIDALAIAIPSVLICAPGRFATGLAIGGLQQIVAGLGEPSCNSQRGVG